MAAISGGGFFSRFRNRINDTTSGVNPVEDITPIETNDTDVEANTTTIPTNAGSMERGRSPCALQRRSIDPAHIDSATICAIEWGWP